MKALSLFVSITVITGLSGCQRIPVRTAPPVPKVAADADASGEQKVMLQMMQQLAEEDGGSIRK